MIAWLKCLYYSSNLSSARDRLLALDQQEYDVRNECALQLRAIRGERTLLKRRLGKMQARLMSNLRVA